MTITATTDAAPQTSPSTPAPASETVEATRTGRPARRTFTAEYTRQIVAEYDQAPDRP